MGGTATLSQAFGENDRVKSAKAAMNFPKGVTSRSWIERRMCQDITLIEVEGKTTTMHLTPNALGETADIRKRMQSEYFDSLPQEGFTPAESTLRAALMQYM